MRVPSRSTILPVLALAGLVLVTPSLAQGQDTREQTRAKAQEALNSIGSEIGVDFRQSKRNQWIFVGSMTSGLKNAESMEILVSIGDQQTMAVRIYPHWNGGYMNVGRARDSDGLMQQLLRYNDSNFLYWGMDDSKDIFAMFNFTLESGFPRESLEIVLQSIENLDKYVGEIAPMVGQ